MVRRNFPLEEIEGEAHPPELGYARCEVLQKEYITLKINRKKYLFICIYLLY